MRLQKIFICLDKGQRRRLLFVLAGTVLASVLEMIGIGTIPAFVGLLVDPERLLSSLPGISLTELIRQINKTSLILLGAALLAGVFLFKNFYLVTLICAETQFVQSLTASISNRLFQAYLLSPYTFHLQRNPAELIRNLTDEAVYAVQFVKAGMRLVREGLVLALVFLLMVLVEPLVSFTVFLLLTSSSSVFYVAVRRVLMKRGELCEEHWSRRVQVITQSFGAIKDAKILGRESHLMELFRAEVSGIQRHETFYEVASVLPRYGLEALSVGVVIPVAVIFVLLGRPLEGMLPVLALLGVAAVRLVPAITAINTSLVEVRYRRPAFNLVCAELKDLEISVDSQAWKPPAQAKIGKMRNAICIENVHYRYPGAHVDSLVGVSLKINAGTAVAFIGISGAGKSTMIDVILGLLTPTAGHVFVDGRDIREDLPAWQRQIGYISQDIYLLDDSIRRNIAFGLPDDKINDVAVSRALQAAQMEDFIRSLPHGHDTPIGNRGIRLSGGQRQRIAIARALYHDPSMLVMDEATNALDDETESAIMEAMRALHGDKTIIIVAHRQSTVDGCDQVFQFQAGLLVQEKNVMVAG